MKSWIAGFVVCFLLIPAANAHQIEKSDPDDTRGRLDMKSVDVDRSGGTLFVVIKMYERWRNSDIGPFNGLISMDFDTKDGPRSDRFVRFRYSDISGLWCEIVKTRGGEIVGEGIATRDRKTAVCSFPRRWLDLEKHLRWKAFTYLRGRGDTAPQKGWFVH